MAKDSQIAKLLVSVGILSATMAVKYVATMSDSEKKQLLSIGSSDEQLLLCENTADVPIIKTVNGTGTDKKA